MLQTAGRQRLKGKADGRRAAGAPGDETRPKWGPLVIVGQARSGTSLLTRLLADTRRFALINDAYLIQYLDGLSARDALDRRQRREFADFVLRQIRSRIISHDERQMYRSIYLTSEHLYLLEESANRFVEECDTGWGLIEAVLSATAELSGCDVWGWKCPPDYMHVDRIRARFPKARFIFMIRDPFTMMRSYKNWPWRDGRFRYHPLIQAIVWRSVVETFQTIRGDDDPRIQLVRFEDLVDQTPNLRAQLAAFLGPFRWPDTAKEISPNTSMTNSSRELTWIEWKIGKGVTGPHLHRFNYDAERATREGFGVLEFLRDSVTSIAYYAIWALRSRDMRRRLKLYMGSLWFRRRASLGATARGGERLT
jgi:hypothetical protein